MKGAAFLMAISIMLPRAASAATRHALPVVMPGGAGGIGFDDLFYDSALGRVVVPAGRTGRLDLIDPASRQVVSIAGFPAKQGFTGAHDSGITSAAAGAGLIFATDRTDRKLYVVDPAKRAIIGSVPLAGGPDYVRYVAPTHEIWVTEPDENRIEVFSFFGGPGVLPRQAGFIRIPRGGPEALIVDAARGHAYTNLWHGVTLAVDLKSRQIVSRWPNGCEGGEGMALDDRRGFLIVGCWEGRAAVLDLDHDGRVLSSIKSGGGIDIIAYSPALGHLYLPGSKSATMALIAVSLEGNLSLLDTVKTVRGAHCAVADDTGGVWVCDIRNGRLLYYANTHH